MKKNTAPPKPFAIHQQYVPAVLAAREGQDHVDEDEDDDEVDDEPASKTKKTESREKPKVKGKRARRDEPTTATPSSEQPNESPSTWNYGKIRSAFIAEHRAKGHSFQDSCSLWDSSDQKKNLLCLVSVAELKRRKFLPKGSNTNPWRDNSTTTEH